MAKATKEPKIIRAETKFNIRFGEKFYTLKFGTNAFIRIKEARPILPTAFDIMDEMLPYEAIPFLINSAIRPEDRDWTSYSEFLEIYDECEDEEAIAKVLPGYLSACGTIAKKLQPAIAAVAALHERSVR